MVQLWGPHFDRATAGAGDQEETAAPGLLEPVALAVVESEGPLQPVRAGRPLATQHDGGAVDRDHLAGPASDQVAGRLGQQHQRPLVLADAPGEVGYKQLQGGAVGQQAGLIHDHLLRALFRLGPVPEPPGDQESGGRNPGWGQVAKAQADYRVHRRAGPAAAEEGSGPPLHPGPQPIRQGSAGGISAEPAEAVAQYRPGSGTGVEQGRQRCHQASRLRRRKRPAEQVDQVDCAQSGVLGVAHLQHVEAALELTGEIEVPAPGRLHPSPVLVLGVDHHHSQPHPHRLQADQSGQVRLTAARGGDNTEIGVDQMEASSHGQKVASSSVSTRRALVLVAAHGAAVSRRAGSSSNQAGMREPRRAAILARS